MRVLFKRYKSKKELREKIEALREEVARLEDKLSTPRIISVTSVERNVQVLQCRVMLQDHMSVEFAKEMYARQLAEQMKPIVEWDLEEGDAGRKVLVGRVYLALKKGSVNTL